MSNAEKIRRFLVKHPQVAAKVVAEKFDVSTAYVYVLRSKMKHSIDAEEVEVVEEPENVKLQIGNATVAAVTNVDDMLAARGVRYGLFRDHASLTQQLKTIMFGFNPQLRLEHDQKEALEMIAHKIGRIINGDPDYADSWADIAGYAKLVADRLETGRVV